MYTLWLRVLRDLPERVSQADRDLSQVSRRRNFSQFFSPSLSSVSGGRTCARRSPVICSAGPAAFLPGMRLRTFRIVFYLTVLSTIHADQYEENLLIRPQQDGTVAAHFQFKTLWSSHHLHSHWKSHYDLFSLAIGSMLNEHEIHELHFSLSNGYWRHKRWGMPPRSAMSGAELWLWLSPFHSDPHSAWSKITSQLSAQFCTSIDFQKNPVTVNPALSFRPEGLMDRSLLKNSSVFFAGLASESVCTENLTPWKKLLPTFAKSGLGTLLSATHLFDSSYTSIALDVRPVCGGETCETIHTESVLSLTVVFNAAIDGKQSWSLFKLFGSTVPHVSPLASSTTILVDISSNSTDNPFELVPATSSIVKKTGKTFASYDLSKYFQVSGNSSSKPFNLAGKYAKNHKHGDEVPPEITITRSVTGYGLHSGGIMARITNSNEKSIRVIYMDVLPWYFRVYLHTLKIVVEDASRKSRPVHVHPESLIYTPSLSRVSPHHVEFLLTLPGNSVTTVTLDFDRTFLKWTEYPPDANHGLYGGSAILTYRSPEGASEVPSSSSSLKGSIVRLYTECLLISLPTPDFSMPYNVICLVSTVLSLAFGPIYSLTTRVIQPADIGATKSGMFTSVINKIKSKFNRSNKDKKE